MMPAFLAAGSRLKARSTSWRTISRTSSSVSARPRPGPTSMDMLLLLCSLCASSTVGPDDREDAVIGPGHAAALHLCHQPVAGQAGPLQRGLVRALPEV